MGSITVAQRGACSIVYNRKSVAGTAAPIDDSWVLVRAAQRGDATAFAELYVRFVGDVYAFVRSRVGDRHLAEDITSETFARALRGLESLEYCGRGALAWFITIARNIVFDHAKSSRARHEVVVDRMPDGCVAKTPEELVVVDAARIELVRCLDQLGDDQRMCVVLRFFYGFSVSETAQILNREAPALRALQHRAIRRLGELIDRRSFECA